MTARFVARPAGDQAYALGEGPVWDAERQRLLWVDILGGTVHAGTVTPEHIAVTETWEFDDLACAVAVSETGDLLVATRDDVIRADSRTAVARLGRPESRLNDGAVDPQGRFVVGSMALDDTQGTQKLVRLDGNAVTVLDDDLTLSNGLAWSPDGRTLYSIDSIPGVIYGRDYPDGVRRKLFGISDGLPDGLCVDAIGNLWIAVWGRGRLECRSPAGDLLAVVEVAAPQPTSCAFAGPDLDILVITTATQDLGPADLTRHPASGRLFTADVGVKGLRTPYWIP
ncbi:SMP-30/gluconolactonase/LRE family protein [Paractinoplanes lichenicola]|uniref:SMP-30/gluconolactonase/LRE family protein n=1 Tax=Paractinoplanes lichenicola TaxID=2802976 RepID=A0ABS1VYB0_9ACTN|nr:SMP-30/gluconolactonase/LRE family protein [Actinoplanes lichenicola]MBL7259486.1 SMP-30/gluconolactonase/LRE family protein [Actinoplanes lichenicola]